MSAIHWFEIPVSDFERAKAFYETVLDTQIHVRDLRETAGSILGMIDGGDGTSGALVHNPQYGYAPSKEGSMVYLIVSGDLTKTLDRVANAGGEVALPKTPLGEQGGGGFVGWIIDTEGNRVGLYSDE